MDENSSREPLLLSKGDSLGDVKKTPLLVSSTKWILKVTMWVIFIAWAAFIFLYAADFMRVVNSILFHATAGSVFGFTGSLFLFYSGPILIIAFLSIAYLIIYGEEEFQEKKTPKYPRFRLRTFPVLVDGPFGVVSAAELIGILLFSVYIIWSISAYIVQDLSILSKLQPTFKEGCYLMLEHSGICLGSIGLYCLAFLFLPIARGSVLLRLIDIPFEHATRYHVWLGHLTMLIFTLHGLFYVVAWAMQNILLRKILEWENVDVANLAGVISLIAGLLMWVTSLPPVRRINFELFFYTHQLYVIFVIFLALHVGDFTFAIAAGGIFLFMIDRFLRFCQSRRTVEIISATCLPCGTVKLVLPKPKNLSYNALSFVFIQVRGVSWLQWHPFSVSSSPLDGEYHLSVLLKAPGEWTAKLRGIVSNVSDGEPHIEQPLQPHSKIMASIEGPYGHESPYHLTYENLILVAGGIGISPFLAILSDILHRIRDRKPCLPRNILIVWTVKISIELPLLHAFDMEAICPSFSHTLNLEIQAYVTRELEPQLEEGKVCKTTNSSGFAVSNRCGMSVLVGTGNIIWSGIYVVVSTIGLVITVGLLDIYYINPFGISYQWYKGLLFCACMVASVCIFGGLVVGLWHLWEIRTSAKDVCEDDRQKVDIVQNNDTCASSSVIKYGCRPDFKEIFGSISERWGHVDAGVIVCGPPTLQTSVAKECRSQNLKWRSNRPIFHFNSHSFDL